MVRTQIQLTERQARALRGQAAAQGVSLAQLIRTYVEAGLGAERPERGELYARALRLGGRFRDRRGARDLGVHHDRYLDQAYR